MWTVILSVYAVGIAWLAYEYLTAPVRNDW